MIRIGRWQQVVAVLMLGLAFVDLAVIDLFVPQLCNDGYAVMPNAAPGRNAADGVMTNAAPAQNATQGFDESAAVKVAVSNQGSLPPQDSHSDSSPASTDEDCFCCCSHVLPGYVFNAEAMPMSVRVNVLSVASLPSPPPQDTFHPPRFA